MSLRTHLLLEVASPLSLPFSIPLPFIFQETKEFIDEEDPRPTSSNGAYIISTRDVPSLVLFETLVDVPSTRTDPQEIQTQVDVPSTCTTKDVPSNVLKQRSQAVKPLILYEWGYKRILRRVNGEGSTPKDPLYKILDEFRSLKLWKEKQERKEKGKKRVEEISQDEKEKIREEERRKILKELRKEKHASFSSHNSCKSLSEELRDYYEGRHSEEIYPQEEGQPLMVKEECKEVSVSSKRLAKKERYFEIKTNTKEISLLRQPPHFLRCKKTLGLVAGTGLSPLIACSVDTGDRGLLSSFVKRWHRETSSFHLPVGEVTITLDNVSSLLHLPVVGDLHAFQPLHVDDAVQMLVDLLMVSAEAARTNKGKCRGPYVRLKWCWIYEHFPSITESTADPDYDEDSPHACRWIATKKTVKSIRIPVYREHLDRLRILDSGCLLDPIWGAPIGPGLPYDFMLFRSPALGAQRVMRQFGYTQTIPAPPVDSWVSYDDIHDGWMHYSDHMVVAGEVCVVPSQCASDFIDWFFRISHLFMTPSQTSYPMSDVCYGIAERLERHLSLGVVTPGSSTHEVIEECLRMVRSLTQDQLVYVRSRRRRRTDQA
ncbi:Protein MAINTENANCE OF MERISTEMS [Glycine soja]